MVKLASIDLGSNSTRLLIAEVNDQGLNVLTRMHIVTKMSEKIEQTGEISTEAFKRVNSALRNFKKLLIENDVDDVFVVGTAALRDAKNSEEIIENIKRKYDFEVEVLSGHEEGITTSIGVLNFIENTENFLIIDIGGRSTEFIYEFEKKIVSKSLNLGVVTLSEKYFSNLPICQELIDEAVQGPSFLFNPNGYVISAFQAALSAIIGTPVPVDNPSDHFMKAVETAIRIGDDCDTVAAIAGSLLGARWGANAIPKEWKEIIHGTRTVGSALVNFAELEALTKDAVGEIFIEKVP